MTIASEYIDELFEKSAAYKKADAEIAENISDWSLEYPPKLVGYLRNYAYKDQNGLCFYCGKHMDQKKATADHIIPRSKGGKDIRENIVAACNDCNVQKGNMNYQDFLFILSQSNTSNPIYPDFLVQV